MNAHASTDVFSSTSRPTLKTIVAQISETKIRALAPGDYDDVITILEYLQAEALKAHAAMAEREKALNEREQRVTKREQDVALRGRVIDVAAKTAPRKRRYLFG